MSMKQYSIDYLHSVNINSRNSDTHGGSDKAYLRATMSRSSRSMR